MKHSPIPIPSGHNSTPQLESNCMNTTIAKNEISTQVRFFSCVWLIAALMSSNALSAESPTNSTASRQEGRSAGDELTWPREFKEDGVKVDIYEPQIEKWEGVDFETRSAVAITAAGS